MNHSISVLFILLAFVACKSRNNLSNSEQTLSNEIIKKEKERQEAADNLEVNQNQSGMPARLRVKENREIDELHPPIVINILGNRNEFQKLKASDLFTKIDYVKLQAVPDSGFYETGADFLVSNKFIYGYSMNGIAQYALDGHFIKYVCKNNSYYTKVPQGGMIQSSEQAGMFIGARWPKLLNGKLYYLYEDRPGQLSMYMEYEESEDIQFLNPLGQVENKNQIRGLGDPLMQLPYKEDLFRQPEMSPLGNEMVGFKNKRKVNSVTNDFFTILSTSGDTLCSFQDFDPVTNFTKSIWRGADDGYNYSLNGILHVRQEYNDTVYQLIPPNQMIPKYVLDFGDKGIKASFEGVDPGFDLIDKFLPHNFLETNNYLFFTYTKNYDCPNTAKNGTLKYSRLIYKKKEKEIVYVYVDVPPNYNAKLTMAWPSAPELNIKNDLDGNPFIWPQSISSTGVPFSLVSRKYLHDKMNLKDFGNYKNLSDNEFIIVFYK